MSSQISPLEKVHTGLWSDHGSSSAGRLTLTVDSTTGIYLIAFLAIFVRLAAGHFWDICCWIWFHAQRTDEPRDGLYHQQQALLRNDLSDSRALWQFCATAWAWRKRTRHPLLRSLPLIAAAFIHFAAFTVAGIFSSRVTGVHSNVLISGPVCGDWTGVDVFDQAGMVEQAESSTWRLSIWRTSQVQSTSCHIFNTTGTKQNLQDCKAWGRKFVPFTVKVIDQCPFADEMCLDGLAVQIETDVIDSLKHLGINSAKKDRIQFKNTMQCAPIKIDGFKHELKDFNETGIPAEDLDTPYAAVQGYTGYAYGPETVLPSNYTFNYYNTTFGDALGNLQAPSYMVDVEYSYLDSPDDQTFNPIPQMNRTDADVVMWFFMNSNLLFVEPILDPVFGATVPVNSSVLDPNGKQVTINYWQPAEPVAVLACSQQWQWFQPDGSRSNQTETAVGGLDSVDASMLNYNEKLQMIVRRVAKDISNANMNLMTVGLGNDALLAATASGWGMAGTYLPEDQWIRELDHWTSMYWNSVQLHISQYAVGNGVQKQDKYRIPPTKEQEWMCNSQIVQRSDHSSFDMLGVLVILCFGVLFVIVNLSLDPIVQHFRKRKARKGGFSWVSLWRRHHVLQLQSVAFDQAGKGDWEHENLIPTTLSGDEFRFPLGREKAYSAVSRQGHNANNFGYENKLPDQDALSVPSSMTPSSQDVLQPLPNSTERRNWIDRFSMRRGEVEESSDSLMR